MIPIKAIYNGIQDGPHPFELWTILEPMGCTCHGQFSSLSINTIRAHNRTIIERLIHGNCIYWMANRNPRRVLLVRIL